MNELFRDHPPYARIAFALLRVVAALIMLEHGAQKMFGALGGMGGHAVAPGSLYWFAGIIELTCGTLVLIGLFARPAALLISGEMAVAYFKVHAPRNFWPLLNRGEIVVMLCFVFLYFAAAGAGEYSLDYLRTRRRPRRVMR
jgi:putative oxidoreductase